ncbi:cache domain-containing sensor histidine kinase [Gracilibacillus alcaliphilus]|uniref:cache domain-containing sensor histidine kinase n=1 Tax=Gracilibacillus alcaliphilus TaxID=1401441 RepID=UPI00195A7A27|nr:sensor histidine kinase [Gracilibacillus alcaliphilus]MBM7676821.1 two-component system sensor histidine kinase YesM [Gracilibacillus alcaliphilus]
MIPKRLEKNNTSLKSILLISFICIAIIPVIFMSVVMYMKSSQIINQNAAKYVTQILQQTNQEIDSKLKQFAEDSISILTNDKIQESLNPQNIQAADYSTREDLRKVLTRFIIDNSNITSASIYLNDGSLLVTTENKLNELQIPPDRMDQLDQYKGKILWSYANVNSSSPQTNLVVAQRAIKNVLGPSTEPIGYLSFTISEDLIFDLIAELEMGQTGSTFILDQTGTVLTSQLRGSVGTKLDEKILENISDRYRENTDSVIQKIGSTNYFIAFDQSEETGWSVLGLVPSDEITEGLWEVQRILLIIIIVWVILTIFLSSKITKSVTNPLMELITTMKTVEKGDFSVRVNLKQNREIQSISNSFNRMIYKVNELIKQVYEREMKEKQAELKALQAQINPHFLYNTLDTFYWMLYVKGEEKIGGLIVSLSSMLRYSISNEGSFVVLKQEMDNVQNYINLQSARSGDKINFELQMAESLEHAKVLKLILQPIVENAVHHGLEESNKDGRIIISTREDQGNLIIAVEDNGIGIEKAQIESFQKERQINNGIGLHNVDERIKLTFGSAYGIEIESEIGKGTRVSIKLPLHFPKKST